VAKELNGTERLSCASHVLFLAARNSLKRYIVRKKKLVRSGEESASAIQLCPFVRVILTSEGWHDGMPNETFKELQRRKRPSGSCVSINFLCFRVIMEMSAYLLHVRETAITFKFLWSCILEFNFCGGILFYF